MHQHLTQDEAVHLFRQARSLYHDERYDDALALFERIVRDHPGNASMWHAHAWCLARMGRYAEARVICKRLEHARDRRAAEIVGFIDAQTAPPDRAERPKNPETFIGTGPNAHEPPSLPDLAVAKGPRTWEAMRSGRGERIPGGIQCARITLLVVSGAGILLLVFSFLMAARLLQLNSDDGEIPTVLISLVTLVLTAQLLITCLAAIGWQHVRGGRIALAVAAACILLLVVPLGTAAGVLILLGLFDRESTMWRRRILSAEGR